MNYTILICETAVDIARERAIGLCEDPAMQAFLRQSSPEPR